MKYPFRVNSEIGKLKSVLLHRPGKELENLTPEYLPRLLFDDIPDLKVIQQEHDYFANALRNRGIEVLYLTTLLSEALHTEDIKKQFVADILFESKVMVNGSYDTVSEFLLSHSTKDMIDKIIAGVRKSEIQKEK
ncbi:MAG TPA: arginine deiminase family protein, partial [Massilibacterium sp.]|nr:arginine deiminase family protein [Massilibacterium sp.]